MNRIVYCPSIEHQKEAEQLAANVGLPIVVGDNEYTKNVEFDRTKVQVLFVPKEKVFDHPKVTKKLFACPIGYGNDWVNFDHNLQCVAQFGEQSFRPKISYMENHYARYIARFPKPGNWSITIMYKNDVIEKGEIQVV